MLNLADHVADATEDFSSKVQRGIKFLDGARPGWENKITLSDLDMSNCFMCVLGQLFGNFFDYLDQSIGHGEEWAMDHGFYTNSSTYADEDYNALTALWRGQIEQRQN